MENPFSIAYGSLPEWILAISHPTSQPSKERGYDTAAVKTGRVWLPQFLRAKSGGRFAPLFHPQLIFFQMSISTTPENKNWLAVSTRLKHVRQIGSYPQVGVNSKMIQITTFQNVWLIRQVSSLTSKTYLSNSFHLSKTRHLQVTMTMAEDSTEKRQYQVPSKQQTVPTWLRATNMFRQFPATHGSQLWFERFNPTKTGWVVMNTSETKKTYRIFWSTSFVYQTLVRDFGHGSEVRIFEPPTKKNLLRTPSNKRSC